MPSESKTYKGTPEERKHAGLGVDFPGGKSLMAAIAIGFGV